MSNHNITRAQIAVSSSHSFMAVSSLSLNWVSTTSSNKHNVQLKSPHSTIFYRRSISCSAEIDYKEGHHLRRRPLLLGFGALTSGLNPAMSILAEEIPKNFLPFVDNIDGYRYVYPSDWREFDFRAHDSAFKDRFMQLQNVRVRFIPTDKKDIHDMGPLEEVGYFLVRHRYASPNQEIDILSMEDKNVEGKNYYTFEYLLASKSFATTAFSTVAVGNGRYYTLTVAANERRWKRYRNQLKVVADSFRLIDI